MQQPLIRSHSPVRPPSITANGFQKLLAFLRYHSAAQPFQKNLDGFGRGIINYLHMRKTRLFFTISISIDRYCARNCRFPVTASATGVTFWSKERIIQLYQTCQAVLSIPVRHSLANLVGHHSCRLIVSDFQEPLYLSNRDPHFVHCHMIDEPIPFDQRRSCLMKDSSSRETNFCSTPFAVEDVPCADEPRFPATTFGALKPIRPSEFTKMVSTGFLCRKLALEFKQAKLSIFVRHQRTPRQRVHDLYELNQ